MEKPYESDSARIRALYRIPTIPLPARVLELRCGSRSVLGDEPISGDVAVVGAMDDRTAGTALRRREPLTHDSRLPCFVRCNELLPFADQSFDMVVMHHTLDYVAALTRKLERAFDTATWLEQVGAVLRPGGVLVGCSTNRYSARRLLSRLGRGLDSGGDDTAPVGTLSFVSCRHKLEQAGFEEIEVFNLIPNADSPRKLLAVDRSISRRSFRVELDVTRAFLSWPQYGIRRIIVELAANRFIEESLFFWANKR